MYEQRVRSTAMSMLQDVEQAEDIAQEVFVTVYKSMLSFNEKSALSTWIYRITVNKCIDHLRSKNYKKRRFTFSTGSDKNDSQIPDFIHPGVLAENREKATHLFKAIKTLPENQQTAFILFHVEELSQREIGEVMQISIKAVESLLQRAKVNLRKYLENWKP